jgi:putative oxidoreductase
MLTATLKNATDRIAAIRDKLTFLGPTLARLTLASVFIGTGWGKLSNIGSTVEYFASLHIPAPEFQARLAAGTEFVGGILLLLGLFTRLAALPMAFTMVIAIITARRDALDGVRTLLGFEEWTYIVLFIWLALAGPGPLSLDALWSRRRDRRRGSTSDLPGHAAMT